MHVRRYYADGRVDDWIDPADVSESLGQRGELLWVDVEDPTSEDVALLAQEFGVHHLAAEDLLEPSERPHLGRYHDHYLLVVRDLSYEDGRLGSRETDLVFGDGWIISVRKSGDGGLKPAPVDEIVRRFERQRQGEGATDEGFLLWVFLDAAIDRFFEVSDALEDSLEEVEETIFDTDGWDEGRDSPPQAVESRITERLYRLRRDQVTFRRVVAPLREAIGPLLRQEVDFVGDAAVLHLRDAYDLVTRVTETADAHRDLLNGALEAHLSITSNRMNLVMKRATSWGAILVSATLVAGIYGMNFRDMPELGWRYGYPLALGLMGLITLILYRMFKRKDWL